MTNPVKHERHFAALAVVLCVVIGLPVLYVLSNGPAVWLVQHSYLSTESYTAIYSPIDWACSGSVTANAILQWYLELWSVPSPVDGRL